MRIALAHINSALSRAIHKSQEKQDNIDKKRARADIQSFLHLTGQMVNLVESNFETTQLPVSPTEETQGDLVIKHNDIEEAIHAASIPPVFGPQQSTPTKVIKRRGRPPRKK